MVLRRRLPHAGRGGAGWFCGTKSCAGAGHAVIVGPAIDDRQVLPQLPCGGGVSASAIRGVVARQGLPPAGTPVAQAPEEVEEEHELRRADDEGDDGDEGVERVRRGRDEGGLADVEVAPRHAHEPEIVHREEDQRRRRGR